MPVKFPFKELRDFHKEARQHIKSLKKAVKELKKCRDVGAFENIYVDFYNFCLRELPLHIEYEEHALFPMMRTYVPEEKDNGYDETLADILNDHKDVYAAIEVIKLMRRLIGGEMSTEQAYINEIVDRANKIVRVLDDHFSKEEKVIFRIAEDTFDQYKMNELAARMTRIKERMIVSGKIPRRA